MITPTFYRCATSGLNLVWAEDLIDSGSMSRTASSYCIEFEENDVVFNPSTWPECGRAIASLLSRKDLADDEQDAPPTLSQFVNNSI
ncbi:hypothetical protein F1880_002732 [Penicillium rolfsii]|nr:hypothetical protein F1880_002732 [Penicillium rolfsii]